MELGVILQSEANLHSENILIQERDHGVASSAPINIVPQQPGILIWLMFISIISCCSFWKTVPLCKLKCLCLIDLKMPNAVKKPTRQWAAWTRQEEESFFTALRQVGKACFIYFRIGFGMGILTLWWNLTKLFVGFRILKRSRVVCKVKTRTR